MIEYRIISSNGFNIYKIRFEGKGKDLKAFCNCLTGKKEGFCKHISALINNNATNIIQPSDKIELLKDVLEGSPLIEANENYIKKLENNWFIYNNTKINNIEDLYNYIESIKNKNIEVEYNKEMKRLALYKAEYYKNGNPKYIINNRIMFIKYNDNLTNFNFEYRIYNHFAHAGISFIESVENILNDDFSNLGIYAYKALFSDGHVTGPFISKYNDLEMVCNRVVVLLLAHIGENKIKEKICVKNIHEIKMESENDQSYYKVPHEIIKTYSDEDIKEIINKKILEIENK